MNEESHNAPRRGFLKEGLAIVIGAVAGLVPLLAGLPVLFDPVRRKGTAVGKVRITTLDSLPADGSPRKFSIFASRVDAWNKYPEAPIGAIYLRRTKENTVQALNVVCPHAGCFVDYRNEMKAFFCPCHNSRFALDGKIADAKSPSPRGMDSLEVEVVNGNEVWVRYQNFRTGHAEKVPAA